MRLEMKSEEAMERGAARGFRLLEEQYELEAIEEARREEENEE